MPQKKKSLYDSPEDFPTSLAGLKAKIAEIMGGDDSEEEKRKLKARAVQNMKKAFISQR